MEHHYCVFYKNDKLQFGWIKELRKSKLVVVPEQGKEFHCSSSRVEHIWQGKAIAVEKEALEYLAENAAWTRDQSEVIELDVIHELCEPGVAFTLDELAENFLEETDNGWLKVALLLRIKSDNKLFQQKKSQFIARSFEEIAEIENQEAKKREIARRRVIEQEWADLLIHNKPPQIGQTDQEHWDQFIHRFRNFLIHFEKSQEKEYFCSLFKCSLKDPEKTEIKLLEYLKSSGHACSWGKLIIQRSTADFSVTDDEIQSSENLLNQNILESRFLCKTIDQRSLPCFTVDHDETRDFDDAVSWENIDGTDVFRIHITDVASFVKESDLLFQTASSRISSLYTPKDIYPMFIPVLSEGVFSLKEKADRAVLTFEFKTDSSQNVIESTIYRSLIHVDKNLSYEEIDSAIEKGEVYWSKIWEFCQKQAEIRRSNGSLEIDRHEIKLDISNPNEIKIKEIRENTPASLMIQELAILTNHLAASYAKEHDLTCLFRNQPPYTVSKNLEEGIKPSLKDINIQPARISLTPSGHSALGLDCYLQITSPIRRFLDLVNQIIIMSHLGNEPNEINEEMLLEWSRQGEEIQREFNLIERRLNDHWKIKYLEQHQEELFEAQFNRIGRNGKAQVILTDLQLTLELPHGVIPEKDDVKVSIDSINPSLNKVSLKLIQPDQ